MSSAVTQITEIVEAFPVYVTVVVLGPILTAGAWLATRNRVWLCASSAAVLLCATWAVDWVLILNGTRDLEGTFDCWPD